MLRSPVGPTLLVPGHHGPATPRFDAPIWAVHTMAWLVERDAFGALRSGLRALIGRGDLGPLATLWADGIARYEERRRTARWRVPRATFEHVERVAREGWTGLDASDREMIEKDLRRASDGEAALRFLRGEADDARPAEMELVADRWLAVERAHGSFTRVSPELPYLRTSYLRQLVLRLVEVARPPEPAEFTGPSGDFSWLAELTFHDEDSGAELAAEDLRNPMRDRVSLPGVDDDELPDATPYGLVEYLRGVVGIDWLVDMIVGPHAPSAGPGPFLDVLARASRLVAPDWERLPLFRSGIRMVEGFDFAAELGGEWYALTGDDLARAADAMSSAPLRLRHAIDSDAPPEPWTSSCDRDAAVPFQRRFVDLLERASATDAAVLLRPAHPDVHDLPRDAAWGALVLDRA